MKDIAVIAEPEGGQTTPVLVNVYLQGGADALHLVAPTKDAFYRKVRPTLAVSTDQGLPLDDVFSFHPDLKPLHQIYEKGELAIIQECGTQYQDQSHFEAEDFLHYGGNLGGGWLGRFLHLTRKKESSPLTALSIGEKVSDSLQGFAAASLRSLDDFVLPKTAPEWPAGLEKLYRATSGPVSDAGGATFEVMRKFEKLAAQLKGEQKQGKAGKLDSFTQGMDLIARLIKANIGLRAATIVLPGWDSHLGQRALLEGQIPPLGKGLAHFHAAMGADLKWVTVTIMSEFGRRIAENSSLGTDHGHGGVHMVMGGGVRGGMQHRWTGLEPGKLDVVEKFAKLDNLAKSSNVLPVKFDYRRVLSAVTQRVEPTVALEKLFPGFQEEPLAIF